MRQPWCVVLLALVAVGLVGAACASGPGAAPQQPAAAAKPAPAAAPAAAKPAPAEQIRWRHAMFGPPREVTRGVEWFAKEVEARSNGRMTIELGYGEVLAKSTEIPEGLKAGAYELGWFCGSYYPGKIPLFSLLDSAFFAPEDPALQGRLEMLLFEHPAIQEEMKKWNGKPLLPTPLESYQMMGKKRIAKVDDLKGVRIRVSGEMAKPLEEFGAVKALVPAPEVYTSLDKGILDMITFPGTYAFVSYKVNEISKYFVDKISLGAQPCLQVVNLDAWNRLPADLQKLLLELAPQTIDVTVAAYTAANEKNYPLFRQQGIEIIEFPAAERAKLVAVAEKHWKAWVEDKEKKNLPGQQVFDFTVAKIKELTGKSPLSR